MTILKSFITPGKTLEEVLEYYSANPDLAPTAANPKKIEIKTEMRGADLVSTEVWDCTEEEHDSNSWGDIPAQVVTDLGTYSTTDHIE
jgi:hypothetical protein